MSHDKRPSFTFAPPGYRADWQEAPRRSGIPYGYFDRGFTPRWRVVERLVFWGLMFAAAVSMTIWS